MKKCPYCAEDIQDAAIKCKHCGEFLDGARRPPALSYPGYAPAPPPVEANPVPWYFRSAFIIIMLASIGPFALPLVWWHPKMRAFTKLWVTVLVLILTVLLTKATVESFRVLKEAYGMIGNL